MECVLYDIAITDPDTAFVAAKAANQFMILDMHGTTLSTQELVSKVQHAQQTVAHSVQDLVLPKGIAVGIECVLHLMHRRGGVRSRVACGVIVGLQFDPLSKDLNSSRRTLCNNQLALAVGSSQRMFVDDVMKKPLKALLIGTPNEYTVTANGMCIDVVTASVIQVPVKDFLRRWRPLSRQSASARTNAHCHTATQLKQILTNAGFLGGTNAVATAAVTTTVSITAQWLAPTSGPPPPPVLNCVLHPCAAPPPSSLSTQELHQVSIFEQVNSKATILQAAVKGWIGRRIVAELRQAAWCATLDIAASTIATHWRAGAVARAERVRLEIEIGERAVYEMMELLQDLTCDIAEMDNDKNAQIPAAPQWQSLRLNTRDTAMRDEALSYARSNEAVKRVLLLANHDNANNTKSVYIEKLPFLTLNETLPLGKPIKGVGRVEWNAARVSRAQLDDFVNSCGLYKHGVPFNAQARCYNTLYAFDSEDPDAIVGAITIKLSTITSLISSVRGDTMPLLYVAIIATDIGYQGRGLGTALYNTAVNACFENGHRTGAAYVLTEAVQSGPGWQWWKRRIAAKAPIAVILAIQMLIIVDGTPALCRGALPCGELLLPLAPN